MKPRIRPGNIRYVRIAGFTILLAVAGCFPPSLGEGRITCGMGGACPPGYLCHGDNRCYSVGFSVGGSGDLGAVASQDLAGTTATGDLAINSAGCSATVARVCSDAGHSATCVQSGSSWQARIDRACPTGSTCANGYCQPPPGAQQCATNSDCNNNEVCVEYVAGAQLSGFCTAGTPAGNMKCTTPGWDNKCATGICASAQVDPAIRGCLDPCTRPADCNNNKACDIVGMPGTIEGVGTMSLRFCQP